MRTLIVVNPVFGVGHDALALNALNDSCYHGRTQNRIFTRQVSVGDHQEGGEGNGAGAKWQEHDSPIFSHK